MINCSFKLFLEEKEFNQEFAILENAINLDEGFWGDFAFGAAAPFKALGGAATNLGGQLLKGTANLGKGAGKGVGGLARAGIGGLQALGGGGKAGWGNIKAGLGTAASGVGDALKGTAQIAASPLTAAIRGVQAGGEGTDQTGQFTMPKQNRNWMQKTFGLNSWDQQHSFGDVAKSYNNALKSGDRNTAKAIQMHMKDKFPKEYQAALAKAQSKKPA